MDTWLPHQERDDYRHGSVCEDYAAIEVPAGGSTPMTSAARAKTESQRLRQPTEVRRRLLVEAAREVIADRGLLATTVRDIAEAGGVAAGTVSYHFTGIAELLGEVLEEEMTSFYTPLVEAAAGQPTASEELRALLDGFFGDDERSAQHWRLWLDFWSMSAHDQKHAEWQRATYRRWRADVVRVMARGQAAGEFVVDDLETTVTEFMTMFDGQALKAYLPGAPVGPPQARAALWGWVERTLLAPRTTPDLPHPERGRTP